MAIAAWFGINATDEELAADTVAFLRAPSTPPPAERNGFIDFLALRADEAASTVEVAERELKALQNQRGAGKGDQDPTSFKAFQVDERIPKCRPVETSCLNAAATTLKLRELVEGHRVFLRRYRAMREKPEFVDIYVPEDPDSMVPVYQDLFEGQRLSLLLAAISFNSGAAAQGMDELEKEISFHRKVAGGARNLLAKMVAYALLERDFLFAYETSNTIPPSASAAWVRLRALLREPTREEIDVVPAIKHEIVKAARWMETRRYVRLSDSDYETFRNFKEIFGDKGGIRISVYEALRTYPRRRACGASHARQRAPRWESPDSFYAARAPKRSAYRIAN